MSRLLGWTGAFIVGALVWAIVIWMCFVLFGCDQTMQAITEPNNPTVTAIEQTAEGAVGLTQALGALWPALIPIGTAAGGVLAAYKRLKPKIIESQEQGGKYYAAGVTLAAVLDDIKKNYPDIWKKIGPKITNVTKYEPEISNTIRGFRHLTPMRGSLT